MEVEVKMEVESESEVKLEVESESESEVESILLPKVEVEVQVQVLKPSERPVFVGLFPLLKHSVSFVFHTLASGEFQDAHQCMLVFRAFWG